MLLTYLDNNLLTEARLLAATGLDATALHALQARRMVPQPAYRVTLAVQCESFFGHHVEETALCYYAIGTPAWIGAVQALGSEDEAFGVFTRRYQARLQVLETGARADVAAEWRGFLDGTYGLCTKSGLPEDIATKEWAAMQVARLAGMAQPDTTALAAAIDLLDGASSAFAPHERERSSRHRLVDAMRRRLGL
jgi:hypothetical protein